MRNSAELQKVRALLLKQTQQLAYLVSPRTALEHGKPTDTQIAIAIADTVGLQCYAFALVIQELMDLLEPQILESNQKGEKVQ